MAVVITGSNTPTAGGITYGDGTTYATTAAGSAGGVLYSAGASAPAFTAVGTSGQYLKSNASSAPTWVTASSGGLIFISSQTISTAVASVDFTTGIDSTYDDYQVVFSNFKLASSSRLALRLRPAPTFATASCIHFNINARTGSVLSCSFSLTDTFIMSNNGGTPDTNGYWSGYFTLSSPNSATRRVPAVNGYAACVGNTAASSTIQTFSGGQDVGAAITGFQFLARSGNLTAGTVALYGMAKT